MIMPCCHLYSVIQLGILQVIYILHLVLNINLWAQKRKQKQRQFSSLLNFPCGFRLCYKIIHSPVNILFDFETFISLNPMWR